MPAGDFAKRCASPLTLIIAVELVGACGMALGFVPRETALFLLGIFVYFSLFAPFKQAVLFTVFSIPLFTALPIGEGFDTMAGWRVIVLILFLRVIINEIRIGYEYTNLTNLFKKIWHTLLGRLTVAFFTISSISLIVAQEPSFGIRKLLFLINIFALFFIIQTAVKNKSDWLDVFKYTFAGGLVTLAIGYAQLVSTFFVPLHAFWLWWVSHAIPVFYGTDLSYLLSYSNTWFSYYENAEPTLRMFSVFPDSHSFALAMVLLLPMALTYYYVRTTVITHPPNPLSYSKRWGGVKDVAGRISVSARSLPLKVRGRAGGGRYEIVIVLSLLAIIFSGTRGVWVSAMPVFFVLAAAFFTKNFPGKIRSFSKKGLIALILFALMFPVASQVQKISQWRHGGQVSETTTLQRISTSFSAEELSNKGRIQIWKSTLESIAKRPLLGVGIGNYPVVLSENVSATKKGASAHSLYLDFIAEIGILGGILVILILLEILRKAIKTCLTFNVKQEGDVIAIAFAGFFAISLLWVMAYNIVDVVLLNDKVLLTFTVLAGLLYAIPKYVNSRNHNCR